MNSEERAARIRVLKDELQTLLKEEAEELKINYNDLMTECNQLLKTKGRSAAVQRYRAITGLSLREAAAALGVL